MYYLGPHGSDTSVAEYDRLVAEYLAAGRTAGVVNASQAVLVAELVLKFIEHAKAYYVKQGQSTTEFRAYCRVAHALTRLYGRTRVDDFGPLALKAVREVWIGEGNLSRKSINQNQGRLIRIFKWGVAEELVSAPTWQALRAVETLKKSRTTARESQPVPPVSIETLQATIPHLSPVVADMVRMQLLTGMRPGEVCMLSPGQIDRTADIWEFRPTGHKTEHHDRDRTIYIGPQAKAVLGPYLFREPAAACFSAAESIEWFRSQRAANRTTPASCGNARGRRGKRGVSLKPGPAKKARTARHYFDTSSYGGAIATACKKAWPAPESLKDDAAGTRKWHNDHRWSPNQIRHTRGTEIRKLYGLEAAQVILGHASADVTQIYAERDADKARDIVRQIG